MFWLESSPALWLEIGAIAIGLGAIVLLAEILHRRIAATSEVARKIVHIGTGNVILVAWWWQLPAWVGIGAGAAAGAIAILSYYIPILPGINGVGRKSLGTFFYAVSIGILIAWFWPIQEFQYAAIGILVMTWGDGFAGLIGQNFGQHPYQIAGIKKSWEGSLTMALVSYIVSSLILLWVFGNIWQTWVVSLAVALVATGLEAFSKFGIDNLTVPVGSAALAFYLTNFFAMS
ncbi:MAG TPA: phosphatidate cytidylyltransferase [Cyanobacteria bacterium UBA11149]|nr:phosphatidate cytidylyltransferase [Cyanobacteria bacterium UBA11367]HBE56726.1 phosphatidate cytidylyltransferase [Cyanobacteria bacterium UBA11366]HBK63030.1 phosphatidate cytidylyltransferase [Cyanobacteria bacterium UBA11166]HBR75934.1 phosphatidate cytidylyltransferase [Cyanobacteria bacterium UBA11159]HBS71403.1 phosphatidate cytidylyltransferase [Cyanobacteria bacterium UBA11153]HBW89959.1 phosphatidate cytidylyltransferase [Cyanobacteria bacterium UBA11149]HCA98173.1 phosphatidate 